jgi:hypothetical protein
MSIYFALGGMRVLLSGYLNGHQALRYSPAASVKIPEVDCCKRRFSMTAFGTDVEYSLFSLKTALGATCCNDTGIWADELRINSTAFWVLFNLTWAELLIMKPVAPNDSD